MILNDHVFVLVVLMAHNPIFGGLILMTILFYGCITRVEPIQVKSNSPKHTAEWSATSQ